MLVLFAKHYKFYFFYSNGLADQLEHTTCLINGLNGKNIDVKEVTSITKY
jgi:hypothetical protein